MVQGDNFGTSLTIVYKVCKLQILKIEVRSILCILNIFSYNCVYAKIMQSREAYDSYRLNSLYEY